MVISLPPLLRLYKWIGTALAGSLKRYFNIFLLNFKFLIVKDLRNIAYLLAN
jgi:hypothetical protein